MTGWVRSSYCSGNGECIEVKPIVGAITGTLAIRNSRVPGHTVPASRAEIDAFVAGWLAGDFDNLEEPSC